MTIKNRLARLEARRATPATAPEEIKRRARRMAELYDSDPQWAQAVKERAREYPNDPNIQRLARIVGLLDIAAARRAIA
jgi:hypothetical protein